jgi:ribosomal protein S18 acetylase RimI-like enzyme
MTNFHLRPATINDISGVYDLYKIVSKNIGGLARTSEEITKDYIENFSQKSIDAGIQFLVESISDNRIVGEIHCYKLGPEVFNHVLGELTIAVHPDYQGKGLGKLLFKALLGKVKEERKDILRVELIARESNEKAIHFYQSLGFKVEGKLMNRIKSGTTGFEADIPMAWVNDNYQS